MALIKCPECGNEISDRAVSCPNCGCPIFAEDKEKNNFNNTDNEKTDVIVRPAYDGNAHHIHECICTCLNCGNEFSYNNNDVSKNKEGRWNDLASAYSAIGGSKIEKSISYNHQKQSYNIDFDKCPRCGSKKIQKRYTDYYVNSNGEYLEGYQPTIADKVSEGAGKAAGFFGDFAFNGCLIVSIIPFLLILYAIYQFVKAIFILF